MNRMLILLIFILIVLIFHYKNVNIIRLNRIIRYLKKTDKILDFGCGRCCDTYKLKQLNYNVQGLDIDNYGICLIPEVYNGKNINYSDNYFDVVICSFVLHHIPDFEYILKELKRVTKKYILIYEDTPKNKIDMYLTKLHSKSGWGSCEHCFNNISEWITIFTRFNLKIINIEEISRFEFPFAYCPLFYPVPGTFFVLEK